MFNNSVFYKQYFVRPIFVKFEQSGQIYKICLKKLESKNNQHNKYIKANSIITEILCANGTCPIY